MVLARLMDRAIGVISTLILARLLVPADFGLVAMATALSAVLELFGAFSFDLALIQNKDAGRYQYDTVWTFNVLFGVACGLAFAALALPAAHYYREPRLEMVIFALAATYIVAGFSNVGVVNFRKHLQFRDELRFMLSRRIVTFFVTIGCAVLWRNYWALVAGIAVGRLASVIISFVMSDYRPSLTMRARRELFHFSKWLLINNALYFMIHSGPNFVIGRLSGASGLGIYSISYEISNLPSTELVAPINRVTFPGFSKMKGLAEMEIAFLRIQGMIGLLILPVGIGIAAVAAPMVLALLGTKWAEAIPLIKLLGIYGALAATQTNNGVVWMALGRPRDLALSALLFVTVLFVALYFGLTTYGTLGAGLAFLLAQVMIVPVSMWNTKRLLHSTWRAFLAALWRPAVSAGLMYAAVSRLESMLAGFGAWPRLLAESLTGAIVYAACVAALWVAVGRPPGAEAYSLARLTSFAPRSRAARFDN